MHVPGLHTDELMTTCDQGRACMTEHFQWTSIMIAALVVVVIALGIWAMVKRHIEEDIEDRVNKDIEDFVNDIYFNR